MKHLNLGTAGHIDHGKTSLVKALTGIDTDRLKEEKARGITIELGFAHLDLPGGFELGIVDVPGHERFVRSMVAGVGGMDLVMLVIAADEGVMPQTREHLDICQLLGVKKGLVALTKIDMVDPDWLGLVTEEVRDYLAGSFLEAAPIMPVSSRTGEGLDRLKIELARLAGEVEEKKGEGPFRLPVDRVFTITGFGTVVTGTLLSGAISVGDEVEVLPAALPCRVRGIQTHGKKSDKGFAGQRVAVNLQGVEHTEIFRGDIVVPRAIYRPTRIVDARLNYLPAAPRELKHRSTLRLHSATYEVPAKVILIDRDVLLPGESAHVQLRLAKPVLLLPGDPFVLRTYSPQATLAGGTVLDPNPLRRRRRSAEALELLHALESGEESEKIRLMVAASLLSGLSLEEIVNRTGMSVKRIESALATLLSSGELVQVVKEPRIFLSRQAFGTLKARLHTELQAYLKDNPMKEGMGKEELKSRIPKRSDLRFFGPCLASLEKEGKAVAERDLVNIPGRKSGVAAEQVDLQAGVATTLRQGGMEPPTIKEFCDALSCTEKEALEHLNFLAREGKAVKVKSDIFYAPEPFATIREKLVDHLKKTGEITPPEFRELTGLSRKFMIPLLEYFDNEKLTIRTGDKRVLRKGS
ncbi:MAG TPA: selenocysteine-specific translation elongation factor [Geobacteraceae bacterium]|nr:selenocysteine-specific translation elongation factor [Geobacteraceae bacterium]